MLPRSACMRAFQVRWDIDHVYVVGRLLLVSCLYSHRVSHLIYRPFIYRPFRPLGPPPLPPHTHTHTPLSITNSGKCY